MHSSDDFGMCFRAYWRGGPSAEAVAGMRARVDGPRAGVMAWTAPPKDRGGCRGGPGVAVGLLPSGCAEGGREGNGVWSAVGAGVACTDRCKSLVTQVSTVCASSLPPSRMPSFVLFVLRSVRPIERGYTHALDASLAQSHAMPVHKHRRCYAADHCSKTLAQ